MWRVFGVGSGLVLGFVSTLAACDAGSKSPPVAAAGGGVMSSGGTTSAGGGLILPPSDAQQFSSICSSNPPPMPLTRYSTVDLDNTLDALFPPGPRLADRDGGYDRELSPSFVQALLDVASERVDAELASKPALEVCVDDVTDAPSCVQPWLRTWGSKIYRRPLELEQVKGYVAQFRAVSAELSPQAAAKHALVSMLLSPYFALRIELGDRDKPGLISQYEIAARLSRFAVRSSPDAELTARAAANELQNTEQVAAQLHRLWALPAGRAARRRVLVDWLGLDKPLERADLDPGLVEDMDAQVVSLLDDVLDRQDGALSALFTSTRQTVSPRLAKHYGLLEASDDLATTPYAGVLATGAFLARNPRPTQRGARILDTVLCQPVPAPTPEHTGYVLGNGATPREQLANSFVGQGPTCPNCHTTIDGPGLALQAFDDAGRLTGFDTRGSLSVPFGADSVVLEGPLALGNQIAASHAGNACAARRLLEYTLDRRLVQVTVPLRLPAPPQQPIGDQAWQNCVTDTLLSFNSMTRVLELLATTALIARDSTPPTSYVVAVDSSADPLRHAYEETRQFRGVFGAPEDEAVLTRYADALLTVLQPPIIPTEPDASAGAAGEAAAGAGGAR